MRLVERRHGTYAKLVPCANTKARIAEIVNLLNIENPASTHALHVTVIYSRVACPEVNRVPILLPIEMHGIKFDLFKNKDNTNCLVLRLGSQVLHELHSTIITTYRATHDYPEFNPHITLSYDYSHPVPNESLLELFTNLRFDQFIVEPLNINWTTDE